MGMDDRMLSCIKALAENRIQDAKNEAICCCINDKTKKNEGVTKYYKKLLENGSTNLFELPTNLKGLLNMQDVSDFNEERYFLGNQQKELFEKIETCAKTTTKMLEYGIKYMNSTLIYGEPQKVAEKSKKAYFKRLLRHGGRIFKRIKLHGSKSGYKR